MSVSARVVTFDCRDAGGLAQFWAEVLHGDVEEEWPSYVVVRTATAGGVLFGFQQVAEGKVVKNRVHVDLVADDLALEIDRLVGLGAAVVDRQDNGFLRWTVLHDPEGNEFCLSAQPDPHG